MDQLALDLQYSKASRKRGTAHWTSRRARLSKTARTGRISENLVVWYLKQHSWHIWDRNYQTHRGEVDIIAIKDGADLRGYPTVAFIEVKSRTTRAALSPELSVSAVKRKKIVSVMRQWIAEHTRLKAVYRCDIASVIIEPHGFPRISYYPNAFCGHEEFGW
ncbi:MAG: YraN family protein [Proteobacteria bacterium]|nr:YraN family protein [Pseudomonadota bacterium]